MRITFSSHAWEDYTTWLKEDRKMLVKINQLIKDLIIKFNKCQTNTNYQIINLWTDFNRIVLKILTNFKRKLNIIL
jgi:Txe/YoeB family toxin of Txe-Axe toxin-antitoxin module